MFSSQYLTFFNILLILMLGIAIYKIRSKGRIWLSIFLIELSLHEIMRWGHFSENQFIIVYLPLLALPGIFFYGSALLFYTNRILFDDIKPKYFFHLIVPIISIIIHSTLLFTVPEQFTFAQIKEQAGVHHLYSVFIYLLVFIYVCPIMLFTLFRIITYRKRYRDNYSKDIDKNIRWLLTLILLMFGVYLSRLFIGAYIMIQSRGMPIHIADEILLLFILLFLVYYLLTKPQILPIEDDTKTKADLSKKYANINMTDDQRKEYAKKLTDYMQNEQPYLEENISIGQFSEELDIPRHLLSMTINIEFEKNFFTYINNHRIQYAADLIKDPDEKEESILMIAFRSGFQSKNSFNKFFKKYFSMTPSEYRKKNMVNTA